MERTKQLYSKNKQALQLVGKGKASQAINILHDARKQINYLKLTNPQLSEDVSSLEIVTLNNLACAYNKKRKFKSSLYNLLKVNSIQTHKYSNLSSSEITLDILHQIATTHSNLCTVYSQMNQHQKALKQIEISICLLENNDNDKNSQALVVFYYNYAMQFQYLRLYQDSKNILLKALILLKKIDKDGGLQQLIQEGLNRIQGKIKSHDKKAEIYLQKCLKGYYPSRKNPLLQAERTFNSRRNFSLNTTNLEYKTISTFMPKSNKKSYTSKNFPVSAYQKKKTLHPEVQLKKLSPIKHLQSHKSGNSFLYEQYLQKVHAPSNKLKFFRRTFNFVKRQDSNRMPQHLKFNYKSII